MSEVLTSGRVWQADQVRHKAANVAPLKSNDDSGGRLRNGSAAECGAGSPAFCILTAGSTTLVQLSLRAREVIAQRPSTMAHDVEESEAQPVPSVPYCKPATIRRQKGLTRS